MIYLQKLALCTDSEVMFVELMPSHLLCSKRFTVEIYLVHRVARERREGETRCKSEHFCLQKHQCGMMPFLNGTVLREDSMTSDGALCMKQSKVRSKSSRVLAWCDISKRHLCPHVHCHSAHNNQETEVTQVDGNNPIN